MSEPAGLKAAPAALARTYDTALLDLDGVVYVGAGPVPGAPSAIERARAMGMRVAFVTNNAARTPQTVAAHLRRLGVPAGADDVVTSAHAAARLLAERVAPGAAVLLVGGAGLEQALRERGLRPVRGYDADTAAVVQGFAPEVGWRDLAEGTLAVRAGLPWVASNLDTTIPTPRGRAPGNGALVEAVAVAAGRRPDAVAGKPEPALHAEAVLRTGAVRPLVVGDRLDTDIDGANRVGCDSLLVLTGVTTLPELLEAPPSLRPSYVARDLSGLLRAQPAVTVEAGSAGCAGWAASISGGGVRLDGAGHRDDALRAVCALVWAGTGRVPADLDALASVLG